MFDYEIRSLADITRIVANDKRRHIKMARFKEIDKMANDGVIDNLADIGPTFPSMMVTHEQASWEANVLGYVLPNKLEVLFSQENAIAFETCGFMKGPWTDNTFDPSISIPNYDNMENVHPAFPSYSHLKNLPFRYSKKEG